MKKRLEEEGLAGLEPKPKRPKRVRQKVHFTPELLERIGTLRKENPTWGRWPIWLTVVKEGYQVSERTVGRILAHSRATAGLAARFLEGVVRRSPYPIRAVQVDGGSEFMAEFDES